MRLLEYLHDEKEYPSEVIEFIIENVKYDFLREIEKSYQCLYRGASKNIPVYNEYKHNINKRNPTTLNRYIHDKFNELSKRKFNWPMRNGVFTTGNGANAEIFGNIYLFFPIGNYKFLWSSEIVDINFENNYTWAYDRYDLDDEEQKFLDNVIEKDIKTYKNTDLEKAIKSGHEIIFNCKEYILVNLHYEEQFADYYHWR